MQESPGSMRRPAVLWTLAVLITLVSAVWQRLTGPTYPVRGTATLGATPVRFKLTRSHGGQGDQELRIVAPDTAVTGAVRFRRYPTDDPWETLPMVRARDTLIGALPHQPPAGKLAYEVVLARHGVETPLTARPVVTRFKGRVPAFVLAPHILAMFLTLLFSARAGLGALAKDPAARRHAHTAALAIAIGGFVLGPLTLRYAFGQWWEGVPLGFDLTDNKTLIAALAWLWAVYRMRGGRPARDAILTAAVVTLAVFAIPHSLFGSEIDWKTMGRG
jgi:hypothetical protein